MIRVFLGKPGSGKTLSAVKEMVQNKDIRYYSNIKTFGLKNNVLIQSDNIIKKEKLIVGKKEIIKHSFNKDFWLKLKNNDEMLNITLDEMHTIFNSRRPGSKINVIVSDFLALIRKMMSSKTMSHGVFTMITQLDRRLDIIGIEMANHYRYHVCFYTKTCRRCGYSFQESNEEPDYKLRCPKCGSLGLQETNHQIESWHFDDYRKYMMWRMAGHKTYYKRVLMHDAGNYFNKYDSLQWENLISID